MPRYKSCSGVLIKKSMELVKKYFGKAVLESAMCTPTDNRGISAWMESGYCAVSAVMEHFDNPETVREAYRQSTDCLPEDGVGDDAVELSDSPYLHGIFP